MLVFIPWRRDTINKNFLFFNRFCVLNYSLTRDFFFFKSDMIHPCLTPLRFFCISASLRIVEFIFFNLLFSLFKKLACETVSAFKFCAYSMELRKVLTSTHDRWIGMMECNGRPVGLSAGAFFGHPSSIPGTFKRGVPYLHVFRLVFSLFKKKRVWNDVSLNPDSCAHSEWV